MNSVKLAREIKIFVDGVPGFWDDLKVVIINKFATIAIVAKSLSSNIFESENIFLNTIIDLVFLYKPINKYLKAFLKLFIVPVIKGLLGLISKDWFIRIKSRAKEYNIANGKIVDSAHA